MAQYAVKRLKDRKGGFEKCLEEHEKARRKDNG